MEFLPIICIWGNSPCNHAMSFKKQECPNCHQITLQLRRTDQCCTLCWFIPLFPTDTGEPYYQCKNHLCNIQLPVNQIGRPVTVGNNPPLPPSDPRNISQAAYSNNYPRQPVNPGPPVIGQYTHDINDSNVYPGNHQTYNIYGQQPSQQQQQGRPGTYGSGVLGTRDNYSQPQRPFGGSSTGFRLSDNNDNNNNDYPQKGATVAQIPGQQQQQQIQSGTAINNNNGDSSVSHDPSNVSKPGNTVAQVSNNNNTTNKQPSAPATEQQKNDIVKQPSAPSA